MSPQLPDCSSAGGDACASVVISHGFCADVEPPRPILVRTVVLCDGTLSTSVVEMDGTPYVGPIKECAGDCCDDAATAVQDTNSIDLSLAANLLSANLNLDPASPAQLTITNNGLYVDCCDDTIGVVQDTDTVDLTLTGNSLTADVQIDPASTAIVTTSPSGLRIDTVAGSVLDGDTIDFDNTGGVLTGEVIVDPASTAPVTISAAGLRIDCCNDGLDTVIDTNSIDLTLLANTLQADLRFIDTTSVDHSVGVNGLSSVVRIDPASPLPISITAAGLSVADTSTGQWVTQVKTVNESFTNIVEQDILELVGIAPTANGIYEVQMLLITSSSSAAVGVQTRLNFPINFSGSGHVIESPDNTYSSLHVRWGGPPISTGQNNVPVVNETFLQRVIGMFDIGPAPGAGNIRPQVRSETGALVTVHRGSIFKWRRVL